MKTEIARVMEPQACYADLPLELSGEIMKLAMFSSPARDTFTRIAANIYATSKTMHPALNYAIGLPRLVGDRKKGKRTNSAQFKKLYGIDEGRGDVYNIAENSFYTGALTKPRSSGATVEQQRQAGFKAQFDKIKEMTSGINSMMKRIGNENRLPYPSRFAGYLFFP